MTSSSPCVSACATTSPVGAMIEELPIISQPSSTPHFATPTTQVALA